MKGILSLLVLAVVVLVGSIAISEESPPEFSSVELVNGSAFLKSYRNSSSVLLELDIYGMTYGHELLWKANTTGTNYEESAVAYLDGIAYLGSCSTHGDGHDKVFAVDTSNGEILWSVSIGPGYVGPVIDQNRIYIGTSSHGNDPTNEYLYCINRSDGNVLWRRNIYGGIAESILYDTDNIYFTSDLIYALNKQNGSIQWTYPLDAYSVTKPILKDNAFFTATSGGTMYKVNVIDGSLQWVVNLPDFSWDNSITADDNGHLYIAVYHDSSINAYREDTGSLLWSYRLHERSLSFNAYHNNVIFIADTGGYVYALNASTGTLLWETKIGYTCDISSPSISGGLLFIGTRDFEEGALFALNETTGDIVWRYPIGASVTAPPTIADGMMLCGTDDWNLYAFDIGIGMGDWLFHRYDALNTAFSPSGLTEWQYVSAQCQTIGNITTCTLHNTYDHTVDEIKVTLPEGTMANWYDATGSLLSSESNEYIIDRLASQTLVTIIISEYQVHRPNKPTISGPSSGKIYNGYTYTFATVDSSEYKLSYFIDWGDGSTSGWTVYQAQETPLSASHIWFEKNTYLVKAKVKNIFGIESEWSDPIEVSMPKDTTYSYLMNRHPLLFWMCSFVVNAGIPPFVA